MSSAQHDSFRSTRVKVNHHSLQHVFASSVDSGMLDRLLSFLCTNDLYNLSVSLPNRVPDYFGQDSTTSLFKNKSTHYHIYKFATTQVQKAIIGLKKEVFTKMQVAAQKFNEGSLLLSGKFKLVHKQSTTI